jgi:hypothetical protein
VGVAAGIPWPEQTIAQQSPEEFEGDGNHRNAMSDKSSKFRDLLQ